MYRSPWELDAIVRFRTAYLTDERRICSQIDQHDDGPARLVTQLRYRLGMDLIKVDRVLAGHASVRRLPTPSARPATWGPGS